MSDDRKLSLPEQVTNKLIEQLEQGTAPWQKPWQATAMVGGMPMNPTTGNRYKGFNALQLMSEGYDDPRWMTFKQAQNAGAMVKKGEKGTPIQHWRFTEQRDKTDAQGNPVIGENGKPEKILVKLDRPKVSTAVVFNAQQIEGLPPLEIKPLGWNPAEKAEQLLQASGADIRHDQSDAAFYRPATDRIHLPPKQAFDSPEKYYATALHELGHWTGHASRLDRDLAHPFGSQGYAKEELRAEIASMMIGQELGIGHDPGQHAAYVGSWIKALKEDPTEIMRAAQDAEKIRDMLINQLEQKQEITEKVMRAEEWTVKQISSGRLEVSVGRMNSDQLAEASKVLAAAVPVKPETEFWQRHASQFPSDTDAFERNLAAAAEKLSLREESLEQLQGLARRYPAADADEGIIIARHDLLSGVTGAEAFAAVTAELGMPLPPDWTGAVQISPLESGELGVFAVEPAGVRLVAARETSKDAEALGDRLALIDAHSQPQEHDRIERLAAHNEKLAERDPSSTAEEISAAQKLRESAASEAAAATEALQAKREKAAAQIQQQLQKQKEAAGERTYLDVPYKQKDEAKALGAKWDTGARSWYVPDGVDAAHFSKWLQQPAEQKQQAETVEMKAPTQQQAGEKLFLAVPYGEREAAKAAGAKWDKAAKSWYAGAESDMDRLQRWLPENAQAASGPTLSPTEEFADALRSMGAQVSGEHPIMDGKKHRIEIEGDKKGEKSGFYIGHLDGHPAGYIKNNRTGVEMKWKSKGYSLDPEAKARLAAEAAQKLQEREKAQRALYEQAAQRVSSQAASLQPVQAPTPYLKAKGIKSPAAGILTDAAGEKTYIPAFDASGKQWSMQTIAEDGSKRFAKDSRKDGCFHPVGGFEALREAPVIIIAEGYATAATLAKAADGRAAAVAAFDSGNLLSVAKSLREAFPDKPIIVAGDDDRALAMTQGVNPGKQKAQEAAELVGGVVMLPVFAPGENDWPEGLEPVTPSAYREHAQAEKLLENLDALSHDQAAALREALLSPEQQQAISDMKRFTDYNDLSQKSELGEEAVGRQVWAALHDVRLQKIEQQERELTQEHQLEQKDEAQKQKREEMDAQRPRRAARR